MDFSNENTPEIKTERLILRKFTQSDAQALFLILNDSEANIFLPWFVFETLDATEKYLQENYIKAYAKSGGYQYAICLKSDNVPIGYVGISDSDSHDLGYGLRTDFWHKGIVTEACMALLGHLRKSNFPFLTATHDILNPRSGEVMKKIGMTYRYSYEELVQPKNMLVTFRMYQISFDGSDNTYKKYWDMAAKRFVEPNFSI